MVRGHALMDRRAASRILEKLGRAAGQGDADEGAGDEGIVLHPHRLWHTFGARYREASGSDTETAAALWHAGLGYVSSMLGNRRTSVWRAQPCIEPQ